MSFIHNIQHITSIENLESILTNGLQPKQKKPAYRDYDSNWYLWFDYIGVYQQQICFSNMGLGTSTANGVVMILDFQKIIHDCIENGMMYDVIIASDMINFTDDTDSITVWSLSRYYYDNETRHHSPISTWDDSQATDVCQNGVELVIQESDPDPFDIKPYLISVITNTSPILTREILNRHGLSHVTIESGLTSSLTTAKEARLRELCSDLSTTVDPELSAIADQINLNLRANKTDMCQRLYQFILMIGTLTTRQ